MFRSQKMLSGFNSNTAPVASSCLVNAVMASLALAAIALCLCVGLTIATSVATFALPLAH